ncbi:hypothetical protein LDO32_19110 [Luteimonas sp. Y-2-2-4F]|nr:hypothetical protein [Luteimonas sp. Y-2-2-4F]MCD9033822.1 hypothetical protein [Luteimonas sp. Y-2-2-4F]
MPLEALEAFELLAHWRLLLCLAAGGGAAWLAYDAMGGTPAAVVVAFVLTMTGLVTGIAWDRSSRRRT